MRGECQIAFFVCNWLKLGTVRMAFGNVVRNENDVRPNDSS